MLSFLADFERALLADDPSPDEGTWQTSRTVNYHNGLAKLQLTVCMPDKNLKPRGSVLLQSYNLADGTACIKAHLGWAGSESTLVYAVFSKPGCDWKSEARRMASQWMAGPPVAPVMIAEEPLAAAAVG